MSRQLPPELQAQYDALFEIGISWGEPGMPLLGETVLAFEPEVLDVWLELDDPILSIVGTCSPIYADELAGRPA